MDNSFNALMDLLTELSIKYSADLASMSMKEVQRILSSTDWARLEFFMKHGGKKPYTPKVVH